MKIILTLLLAFISLVTYSQKIADGGGGYAPNYKKAKDYPGTYFKMTPHGAIEISGSFFDSLICENNTLKLMLKEAREQAQMWQDLYETQKQRRERQIKAIDAELKKGK